MKQITRLVLLVITAMLPQLASAYDFMVDGLCYNYNSDGTSVTVTYFRGPYSSSYSNLNGSLTIPATVPYNGSTYSVTSIGISAFYSCGGLTSVTIPNSVTSIGENAFCFCYGLNSVTIPNTVTSIGDEAFHDCRGLTSIIVESGNTNYDSRNNCNAIIETATNTLIAGCMNTIIPNSVTTIGDDAFFGCSGLTSVTIPNSVTSIGKGVFSYCTGLTSVTIPNSVTSIGNSAFSHCTGLTSLTWNAKSCADFSSGIYAQFYQTNIKTITFGEEVEKIPALLCCGMSGLTSVDIPNSVTSIGESAFSGCTGLTSVTIPNSVTSIGDNAFESCIGLTSVTIGNSVTSIGSSAFSDCYGLTSVTIGNSVTSIGNNAFSHCTSLTSFTIPNSVTTIGGAVFFCCSSLTSVTIPNSVTSIGENAFGSCTGLTSVTIPNSVTSIGSHAFSGCSGMTSVTIPNSVTSIGSWAFNDCSGLTNIYTYIDDPINSCSTGNNVFNGVNKNDCILTVPIASISLYKSTRTWKDFIHIYPDVFVTEIHLNTTHLSMSVGQTETLTASVFPTNACDVVSWISSNAYVATVDQNGTVFANEPGTSTITASTRDGSNLSASCIVTVAQLVTSIELSDQNKILNVGESFVLSPTILPENATDKSVTWSSGNPTVASVDSLGNVTALKRGTVTITATTNDGSNLSASCVVTVIQPVTGITLNENSHTLKYNGQDTYSFQLTATTLPSNANNHAVQWTSSDENVATVSSDGTVTSTGKGVATITATTTDGSNLSDSCIVTVEQLATEISLDPQAKTLNVGESFILSPNVLPETADDKSVTWSSNAPTVASVDSLGNVTALKRGTATITATTKDGSNLSASCVVTVAQPVTGISLNYNTYTLKYNDQDVYSFNLTATTTPNNANNAAIVWSSSNDGVATVTSDGTVTSTGKGVATITATTTDGSNLSDSCIVTVEQLATEITLEPQAKTLNVGESFVLLPTVLPENANDKSVTWSSNSPTVASVDSLGNVTALKRGTATITATTKDGSNLNASCVVAVLQPVTGISLNENSHTLLYNDQETYSFTLTATTLPNNANNHVVQWASSDENIATVTDDGEVTSTGLGTAVITATTTDGSNLSDSCVVTVEPVQTTSFSIDKIKEVLTIGNSLQVTGTVDDAATIKNFSWTSSNDAVASVDANGLVRGVGAGTASITATTIDGSDLSASCVIQVLYPSETAGAGDVNEDGRIDITDATLIVSYLQGNYPMSVLDEALMDVNGDGDINMSDVLRVISLIRNDN